VIDLTSDLEEPGIGLRATRIPSNKNKNGNGNWRDSGDFAASNRGLPDPEEFKKSSSRSSITLMNQSARSTRTSYLPKANTSAERSKLPRVDLTSNNPTQMQNLQRQHAPILPGSTLKSRKGIRDHKNGNIGNTGTPTSIHTGNESRVQGRAQKNGQYPPIYPSMAIGSASGTKNLGLTSRRSESREQQRSNSDRISNGHLLDNAEDISFTYSPLRTESQPSDLKRRKHQGFFHSNASNGPRGPSHDNKHTQRPPILRTPKTIITGASRIVDSASPKVGLNEAASQSSQKKSSEEREWTLKTQVIPHTRTAMSQHEGVIPHAQLHKIGQEASAIPIMTNFNLTLSEVLQGLVNDPGFERHLDENDNKLSPNYEQNLARAAQQGIASAVDRYIRALASASNSAQHEDSLALDIQSTVPEANHATPASADSPDSVEIFENSHEIRRGPGLRSSRARDTSSPATSFSNSREESQQVSEDDDGDIQPTTQRRSNPRRARAPRKDYRLWGKRQTASSSKQTTTQHTKQQNPQASDGNDSTTGKKVAAPAKRLPVAEESTPKQESTQSSDDDEFTTKKVAAKRLRVVKESTQRQHGQQVSNDESKEVTTPAKRSRAAKKDFNTAPLRPPVMSSSAVPFVRDKLQLMARQRELHGMAPVGPRSGKSSYKTMATNALEDSLVRDYQWASQSGDTVTITWTGQSTFVSGALTHYDVHNMQYNRYGNLAVGSTSSRTVKMVDGHRTLRPVVTPEENKENSLPAMRATQDDWRYAPVVSSAYCEANSYTFTASYDKTVKIWKVSESGPAMELRGIWEHDFFVNFVVTSKHHDKVATASEAHNDAVRVYMFDETDVSQSAYDVYNAGRALNRPGDLRMADNWAYHPATLQWGRAEKVSHLLLVGYSPRGTNNEEAIPDTKKNSGELCCWDTITGEQVHINASKSQNVFEVIWHPTQPIFLVAAAPSGTYDTKRTKTQVRLFQLQGTTDFESFQCIKTLDCPAADINELTIM
jgi:hypothetical protein